jgi:fatty acid synthase
VPFVVIQKKLNFSLQDVKCHFEKFGNGFRIVAYSFGVLVALELANMLEKINMKGQLILIDGAPDFVKHSIIQRKLLENKIQLRKSLRIYESVNMKTFASLDALQEKYPEWKNILNEEAVGFYKRQDEESLTSIERILKESIKRVECIEEYDDSNLQPIESKIVLIKSGDSQKLDVDETYGLSRLARSDITVKCVSASHAAIMDDDELPQIINENLIDELF